MFENIKKKVTDAPTATITKERALQLINECSVEIINNKDNVILTGKVYKPKLVKRYDLLYTTAGSIPHPCVIIRIRDNNVYCLSITSQIGKQNIKEIKNSRFFENNYFYNNIISLSLEDAQKCFVGVFDSKKEVDEAVKLMKEYYLNIL